MQVTLELRAFDRAHIDQARKWRNDWRIWAWTRQNDLISDWDQEHWFERQSADTTIRMYAVVLAANGVERFIGVAGLTSLSWQNRHAEFSLYIAPEHQKAGHGRTALRLLLDHAFRNLGLNQVWGEVFDGNVPALKTFEKLGFKLDGKLRQRYHKDGRFVDTYMISILAEEWRALHAPSSRPSADSATDSATSGGAPSQEGAKRRGRRPKLVPTPGTIDAEARAAGGGKAAAASGGDH